MVTAKERFDQMEKMMDEFQEALTKTTTMVSWSETSMTSIEQKLEFILAKLDGLGRAGATPLTPTYAH